jgi:uncharacterized protein YndB with AHSA1/START domain
MILRFEREWPVPPEVAWPYLTVPDQMNLWSEARVTPVSPGATGRHDEPGAVRRVVVRAFGLASRLDEVVVAAERPHRFAYRVTAGGALRDHGGEITLASTATGARLVWEVRFAAAVPGLEYVLAGILRPRLARSLDALGARLVGA